MYYFEHSALEMVTTMHTTLTISVDGQAGFDGSIQLPTGSRA
jgi:hypothetical protein